MKNTKMEKISITVEVQVNAAIDKVWQYWTEPVHIVNWNFASDDWCAPKATNDLKVGGKFSSRMEAKDGTIGFDFSGVYDQVKMNEIIDYTLDDDRKVKIVFSASEDGTKLIETFEAETENSIELQKGGWQAILNNFKKYAELN
jgi:uncharacterized protein YndB with AHSA1/START domain